MPFGFACDRGMVRAFQEELVAQGLLTRPVPELELFPLALEPANVASMNLGELTA